jgi:carbamoyltransferase
MKILGINETSHDAAVCLIEDGEILYASHAERFSGVKNDVSLNSAILQEALSYGTPDRLAYFENSALKRLRLLTCGGLQPAKPYYKTYAPLKGIPVTSVSHHESHASAGYYTSGFDDAVVIVLDAIGEFTTSSVWVGEGDKLTRVKSWSYPYSFGLFYSAFTQLIGLKPNEEEYILMGMSAYGDPEKYLDKVSEYFPSVYKQNYNFHKGINNWGQKISEEDKFHIAASVQKVYEDRLWDFVYIARQESRSSNLVFMGGCALNSKANTLLHDIFPNVWIMPNPGDAGSSLGAAASVYGAHLNWQTPYLGSNIAGDYPVQKIVDGILSDGIVAVASGRAEFGPRALGNRSLLADARDPRIKLRLNEIKGREDFRPVAPVVLEEYAHEWFDMDYTSPYMQFTPRCLRPELIPAAVHVDGTSRVQTVNRSQHQGLYDALSEYHKRTGIPVLLNTSLNIKGQPLVNTAEDARQWSLANKMEVLGA